MTSVALVIVALALSVANAANFSLSVTRDARRVIDLGSFGYHANGKMLFVLKDFFLHDTDEYATATDKIGFTLDKVVSAGFARQERSYAIRETKKDLGEEHENICFIDDPAVSPTKRFTIPLQDTLNQAMTKYETASSTQENVDSKQQAQKLRGYLSGLSIAFTIPEGAHGVYALFFYNCKKSNKNKDPAHVSFKVSVSQYNIEPASGGFEEQRNYLSVGEYPLATMYAVTFLVFAGGLIQWHRMLFHSRPEVVRNVRSIHHLMYFLVVLKLITLALHIIVLHRRRDTGKMSGGWDYIFYFFQTVKGIALFSIIVLLGTGWSLLKPFLSDRDRTLLFGVLPLQLLANIALAVIEEQSEGSASWGRWRDALRLFDVACCCAVLLPVIWSIRAMKDGGTSSRAAQRSVALLKQFRSFYIAAVVFIYFTRIVIEFVSEYLPYDSTWVANLLYEVAAVMFYAFVARQFQPSAESTTRRGLDDDEAVDTVVESGQRIVNDDDVEDITLDEVEDTSPTRAATAKAS